MNIFEILFDSNFVFDNYKSNVSYSSKQLLKMINKLMSIEGKMAELKILNDYIIKPNSNKLCSFIYCKEGILTDFTFDQYKYRQINENTQMHYFQNKCFLYDSKIFINLNKFIEINIWDEVFDYPDIDINFEIKKVHIPRTVYIDFIDYEWLNSLLYKKENVFENVKKELTNFHNYSIHEPDNEENNDNYLIIFDKCPLLQRKKYNELHKYKITDLIEMITTSKNKYPYKIIQNYLQYDLCRWIKEETINEKNIEKTTIFKFMKFFLQTLGNDFKKIYLFDKLLKINYTGIEIISNYIKRGTFTAIICLNECKINDNELKIGDLYLCSSIEAPILNIESMAIYIDFVL